jgi:5-methylcytosine-specific restriction endonuclease McrA
MVKYKKVYCDYFGYDISDWIGCERCPKTATEIHHIIFKSQGGKDVIENLMAICYDCHQIVHNNRDNDPTYSREFLTKIHLKLL